MDLENIKNSTKQSIIQNFMENVKHAPRGASHQRQKSWSKGTKSGSDKKKMRREGKDAAREMNENKGTQGKEMMVGGGAGAMDKAVLDAAATFSSEGVHIPKLTPRVQEILKNEIQWRQNLEKQIGAFGDTRGPGQMTPQPVNEEFHTAHQRSVKHESLTHDAATFLSGRLGVPYENLRRQLDKHPQAPFTSGTILDATKDIAGEHHADLVGHLSPTIERFRRVSDRPLWHPAGTVMLAGPNWGETPSQGDIHDFVILSPREAQNTDAIHDARGDGYRPIPLPGVEQSSDRDNYYRGRRRSGGGGGYRGYRSMGDLSENSYYEKLKTALQEQGPMGWHEGDPELESDVLAKHTASLSPEERDPFHLIDQDERDDIHQTLQRPHGAHLVRSGLLGRIQTIAGMAKQTPTGKDDPLAMQRISQLIDYGNKAIDQHHKDLMSYSDGRDIPR
jgi:hypothetical protein